jgi:hypothetical protein
MRKEDFEKGESSDLNENEDMSPPLFSMGQLMFRGNIRQMVSLHEILDALMRHLGGEWSHLQGSDRVHNEIALATCGNIWTTHRASNGVRFNIITDQLCQLTVVLLPQQH